MIKRLRHCQHLFEKDERILPQVGRAARQRRRNSFFVPKVQESWEPFGQLWCCTDNQFVCFSSRDTRKPLSLHLHSFRNKMFLIFWKLLKYNSLFIFQYVTAQFHWKTHLVHKEIDLAGNGEIDTIQEFWQIFTEVIFKPVFFFTKEINLIVFIISTFEFRNITFTWN